MEACISPASGQGPLLKPTKSKLQRKGTDCHKSVAVWGQLPHGELAAEHGAAVSQNWYGSQYTRAASFALLSAMASLWTTSCWSASRCIPSFTHSFTRLKFQRRSTPTRSTPEGGVAGSGHIAEPTRARSAHPGKRRGRRGPAGWAGSARSPPPPRPWLPAGNNLRAGEAGQHRAAPRPARYARGVAGPGQAHAGRMAAQLCSLGCAEPQRDARLQGAVGGT